MKLTKKIDNYNYSLDYHVPNNWGHTLVLDGLSINQKTTANFEGNGQVNNDSVMVLVMYVHDYSKINEFVKYVKDNPQDIIKLYSQNEVLFVGKYVMRTIKGDFQKLRVECRVSEIANSRISIVEQDVTNSWEFNGLRGGFLFKSIEKSYENTGISVDSNNINLELLNNDFAVIKDETSRLTYLDKINRVTLYDLAITTDDSCPTLLALYHKLYFDFGISFYVNKNTLKLVDIASNPSEEVEITDNILLDRSFFCASYYNTLIFKKDKQIYLGDTASVNYENSCGVKSRNSTRYVSNTYKKKAYNDYDDFSESLFLPKILSLDDNCKKNRNGPDPYSYYLISQDTSGINKKKFNYAYFWNIPNTNIQEYSPPHIYTLNKVWEKVIVPSFEKVRHTLKLLILNDADISKYSDYNTIYDLYGMKLKLSNSEYNFFTREMINEYMPL